MVSTCSFPRRPKSAGRALKALAWLLPVALMAGRPAFAALPDIIGSRALSMGGASRAAAAGPTALLLNPSGMSLARTYTLSGMYQFRSSDDASQAHVSIVDSVTTMVAAGLFYNFSSASPAARVGDVAVESKHKAHEIGLALSLPLGAWASIGLTGRYVTYDISVDRPEDEIDEGSSYDKFTMDVGATGRLGSWIQLAVTGYNLIAVQDQLFPRALGLGVALVGVPNLTLAFDSVLDFSSDPDGMTASFHGGAELLVADHFALRTGIQHERLRDATYASGGLAAISQRIALEVGLRQQVDAGNETLFNVALQLYLN